MLKLSSSAPLKGEILIPGDKSISHRAVILGSIAKGDTRVHGFLDSADCRSTIDCFRRLGISTESVDGDPHELIVHGRGMHGLCPALPYVEDSHVTLYTGNSGTTTRLMAGILAPQSFASQIGGDASVNSRPMKRVMEPLRMMGAQIESVQGNNCAPLLINGSSLHGMSYATPVASAQVKSAILLAGLYASDAVTVTEPSKSRDHSERMLTAFGADVRASGNTVVIRPADELYASEIHVPGDISSAAFFIAAALITPGSEVLIRNVGTNKTRDGILRVAKAMGADIEYVSSADAAEPYADLLVRYSHLKGTVIEKDLIPALIDELPVIAVMGAAAEGTTIIRDAAELRVKESDRIAAMAEGLAAMGADVTTGPDSMTIRGGAPLHGSLIRTFSDHRIAMSFAVASLIASGDTVLDDERCVDISYPTFFGDLAALQR